MKSDTTDAPLDLIWEVEEIAKVIRQTPNQTRHLLKTKALPGKKIGARWCVSESALRDFFRDSFAPQKAA